ncbi:hypothetical protein M9979_02955 [Sphingomonas sp. RP10(2022)]|uniref:Uncharacterized protein n=1 Tax=Sphingomonas liriopis TaxID=2949094 RepID=A0A9X2HT31_9SPHN|nr:hypothetical protein [Sphingomonas liriopis]MCP3733836.1 hypothetical protein [Sphingomonas liriopis]
MSGEKTVTPPLLDADTVYRELCADFRSLNAVLWQTPLLFMTLTGGLWFGVASLAVTEAARVGLLAFAGLANLVMIVALYRLRYVMQRIQEQILTRDGRAVIGPNYMIVTCFAVLLLVAACGSLWAAAVPERVFPAAAKAPR